MQRTYYDSPICFGILRTVCGLIYRALGWQVTGELPPERKFVLIAAPHTSNWDFPLMLAVACAFEIRLFWVGKHTLFRGPMGVVMRWLGGIPVERGESHDLVATMVAALAAESNMALAIPPEGTRAKVRRWRSGFYYTAHGAGVPIVTGFLDYRTRTGGVGPTIYPSGEYETDLARISAFYATIAGRYPDQSG